MTSEIESDASSSFTADLLAGAVIACVGLGVLGLLFVAAIQKFRPGTDAWTTVTVENASSERALVTPVGDCVNRYRREWGRGMLLFEGTHSRPPMRLKRFEVAAHTTWTMRFDPGISLLECVMVEGADGRARAIRMTTLPQPSRMFDKQNATIADVASVPDATAQERAMYDAIPELRERELSRVEVFAVAPAVTLPWVVWMWWRSRSEARSAAGRTLPARPAGSASPS